MAKILLYDSADTMGMMSLSLLIARDVLFQEVHGLRAMKSSLMCPEVEKGSNFPYCRNVLCNYTMVMSHQLLLCAIGSVLLKK